MRWIRPAGTIAVLLGFAVAYATSSALRAGIDRTVSLLREGRFEELGEYLRSFGAWGPMVSALLMVLQSVVAPLPAFVLAYANGLAYGPWWGGLLSLTSATLAAAISFAIARSLGRDAVERITRGSSFTRIDRWFARWGAWAVLVARLVPVVSFDVVSYAAGLTAIRLRPFLLATFAGAAPASFVYAYLGRRAPHSIMVLFGVFGAAAAVGLAIALRRRWGTRSRRP